MIDRAAANSPATTPSAASHATSGTSLVGGRAEWPLAPWAKQCDAEASPRPADRHRTNPKLGITSDQLCGVYRDDDPDKMGGLTANYKVASAFCVGHRRADRANQALSYRRFLVTA